MQILELKELRVGDVFPINEELAGIVPMASAPEQAALTDDILNNGLKEPVVLYRGEVVDGRCRQIACKLSGVPVRAKDLDDSLTEAEVRIFVKSVNTRRNLTMCQKIMVASKESRKPESKSLQGIADAWGISKSILIRANYIAKHKPEFVEPLFNGLTVTIKNKDGVTVDTNKISAIHAFIKREEESVVKTDTHTWTADLHINTQEGKDFFFEFINEHNIKSAHVWEPIAFWINSRFKASSN